MTWVLEGSLKGPPGAPGATGPAGPPGGGAAGSAYLAAPSSPDAWDLDASLMTDPDLAHNGWTIQMRDSPWTVLTRAGEIDYTLAAAAAGTYRSTLRGDVLVLQLPLSSLVQVYKTTSNAHTYKTHVWNGDWSGGNSNYVYVSDGPNFASATASVFYYCGVENNNEVEVRWVGPGGGSYSVYQNFGIGAHQASQVKYLVHDPVSKSTCFCAVSRDGYMVLPKTTGGTYLSAAYAGLWLIHTSYRFVHIGLIRRVPYGAFP